MSIKASCRELINKTFNGTMTKQLSWNIGAMEEQSEGGGQVLDALKNINEITENVKKGGDDMQSAAHIVFEKMTNEVDKFKV